MADLDVIRRVLPARLRRGVRFWRVFRRQRQSVVALATLAAITAVVPITARFLAADPQEVSADVLAPPSTRHLLGTDYLGRDVLVRLLHGISTSLSVGAAVAMTATAIGIVLGLFAGFYGGWVEHAIMRLADGLLIIPTFFLVLLVAFIFGGGLASVVFLLGVTAWPQISRIVRAEVLTLREEAFVASARALGARDRRIIFRELLPNTLPPVIAMVALLGSYGILTEASLSFLGVGDPNVISLGQMLTNGLESATTAWWVPAFPGAAIFTLVVLLNVLGDGLNVALNPRLGVKGVVV
jgi:peptide/nickel transport system permease protein